MNFITAQNRGYENDPRLKTLNSTTVTRKAENKDSEFGVDWSSNMHCSIQGGTTKTLICDYSGGQRQVRWHKPVELRYVPGEHAEHDDTPAKRYNTLPTTIRTI